MRAQAAVPQPSELLDHPREECGVVGVYSLGGDSPRIAYFGLFTLQHRGQESAGIAASDGETIRVHTNMGLVAQGFDEETLRQLSGNIAIGHTRYSTTGSSQACNAQPFLVNGVHGELALGHNGNIVNALEIRKSLQDQWNCQFTSTTDSEAMAYLLANAPGQTWEERVFHCMRIIKGAFSVVVLSKDTLIGFRDPLAVRPLCIGELNDGWVIASESCALDHLGAKFLKELDPGEIIVIDKAGMRSSIWPGVDGRRAHCVFELIYFARPDSIIDSKLVYSMRKAMGSRLAREHPVDADVVIGIPDSATAAAVGFAQESGIPYSEGIVKNRYVGRTFIQPNQHLRDMGVTMKYNPMPEVIDGERVVVIDDSIVRGTTTPQVVSQLRRAGAVEVHMRVCAPPIRWPCHLGVDMATRRELIAANKSIEEIRQFIGADSLGYLSIPGLMETVEGSKGGFCNACFTGNYPIPVQLELDKLALERT